MKNTSTKYTGLDGQIHLRYIYNVQTSRTGCPGFNPCARHNHRYKQTLSEPRQQLRLVIFARIPISLSSMGDEVPSRNTLFSSSPSPNRNYMPHQKESTAGACSNKLWPVQAFTTLTRTRFAMRRPKKKPRFEDTRHTESHRHGDVANIGVMLVERAQISADDVRWDAVTTQEYYNGTALPVPRTRDWLHL